MVSLFKADSVVAYEMAFRSCLSVVNLLIVRAKS